MRILFVTPLYLPFLGGLEVLCSQLLAELRARGHEVAVITAVNEEEAPLGVSSVDGVSVMRVAAYDFQSVSVPLSLLRMQRAIAEFIAEFRPDVADGHDRGPVLWHFHRATLHSPVPLVMTLHNVMTAHAPENLPGLSRLLRQADWVTGVSEDVVSDALGFAEIDPLRVTTVRNGVVPPLTETTPVNDGSAHFVGIGRLVPQKGFDRLLDAFARVTRDVPDARLTIAGTGDLANALVAQAEGLGITSRVEFAGRIEHSDIGALFSSATALVMASRFEGLPLVALEAAWSARPVIGTDAPGMRLAVEDGLSGLLVPAGDLGAFAAAMVKLALDRSLARRLGEGARAHAQQHWTLAACVDAYESIYARVTGA